MLPCGGLDHAPHAFLYLPDWECLTKSACGRIVTGATVTSTAVGPKFAARMPIPKTLTLNAIPESGPSAPPPPNPPTGGSTWPGHQPGRGPPPGGVLQLRPPVPRGGRGGGGDGGTHRPVGPRSTSPHTSRAVPNVRTVCTCVQSGLSQRFVVKTFCFHVVFGSLAIHSPKKSFKGVAQGHHAQQ